MRNMSTVLSVNVAKALLCFPSAISAPGKGGCTRLFVASPSPRPASPLYFGTEGALLFGGRFEPAIRRMRQLRRTFGGKVALCSGRNGSQHTVVDVGAGHGALSALLVLAGCIVHAIEPVPGLATAMERTALEPPLRARLHVHRFAASSSLSNKGAEPLHVPLNAPSKAHRAACASCEEAARCSVDAPPPSRAVQVHTTTLRSFALLSAAASPSWPSLQRKRPTAVVVDVMSDEAAVLRGAWPLLSPPGGAWRAAILIVAVSHSPRRGGGCGSCPQKLAATSLFSNGSLFHNLSQIGWTCTVGSVWAGGGSKDVVCGRRTLVRCAV